LQVGAIEILPVLDGVGKERAAEVLTRPGVPDAWACHADSLDEHGTLHLDLGGFLVRTDDRVVLVDAGVGTINTDKYAGGGFLTSLDRLGVTAEMVTDVVFTLRGSRTLHPLLTSGDWRRRAIRHDRRLGVRRTRHCL